MKGTEIRLLIDTQWQERDWGLTCILSLICVQVPLWQATERVGNWRGWSGGRQSVGHCLNNVVKTCSLNNDWWLQETADREKTKEVMEIAWEAFGAQTLFAWLWCNRVLIYNMETKDYFAGFPSALFTAVKTFMFYIPSFLIHMVKAVVQSINMYVSGAVLC